ncbi:ATP-dependent RNA helicase dbp5-like [Pyrus ussuriensis x Pyrus communis]|uniref:ATP-dependent RNA helicase dbp5-like n=1 Tax=Pyrus ussuriensis x Pyrus communis TaxID=2448454 RepID=A0A5N5FA76_9ROSA|nr:ATP-dependent RNA helicase dbp5-like [Pyrus ussuriensis x Pyrus communis]
MKTIFKSHNLWSLVEDGFTLLKEGNKKDEKIANQESTKDAWDVLKQEFKARLSSLVNKMKVLGETLPNKRLDEKMLISLTPTYDNIVSVIEGTRKLDEIDPNKVVATLKGFEQSDKAFSGLSIQNKSAPQTKGYKGKKPFKFRDKMSDFKANDRPQYANNPWFNKETTREACKICGDILWCRFKGKPKCHNCGRFNHFARDCRSKPEETSMFFACNSAVIVKSEHVCIEGDDWEWHKRLGHLNFNSLQQLSCKKMVLGLPKLKKSFSFCEWCIAGKLHIDVSSKELTWRARNPLELVHSDVCGPMQMEKGYKIYNLSTKRIFLSKNVVFDEKGTWS